MPSVQLKVPLGDFRRLSRQIGSAASEWRGEFLQILEKVGEDGQERLRKLAGGLETSDEGVAYGSGTLASNAAFDVSYSSYSATLNIGFLAGDEKEKIQALVHTNVPNVTTIKPRAGGPEKLAFAVKGKSPDSMFSKGKQIMSVRKASKVWDLIFTDNSILGAEKRPGGRKKAWGSGRNLAATRVGGGDGSRYKRDYSKRRIVFLFKRMEEVKIKGRIDLNKLAGEALQKILEGLEGMIASRPLGKRGVG